MKRRSPWLMYVGLLVSAGFFMFAWVILLMRDVNQLERRAVFPVKSLTAIFLFGIPAYFLAVIFLPDTVGEPSTPRQVWAALIFIFGVALYLLLIIFLVRVSLHVTRALVSPSWDARDCHGCLHSFSGGNIFRDPAATYEHFG